MGRLELRIFGKNISEGEAGFLLYSSKVCMFSFCPITGSGNFDHLIKEGLMLFHCKFILFASGGTLGLCKYSIPHQIFHFILSLLV